MDRRQLMTFRADWLRPAFVHFRLDAATLQPSVPFELDTFDGDAIVSLVAFTQSRLRPVVGGRLTELLSTPLATHEFLNLRSYVRHGNDRGIYFLAEWIPNRLAQLVGPAMYGLPYRLGRLNYDWNDSVNEMSATVRAREGGVQFEGRWSGAAALDVAREGSIEHFLVERYSAFTTRGTTKMRFDVDHVPWPIASMDVTIQDLSLVRSALPQLRAADLIGAHHSPGVHDVLISAPKNVSHRHECGIIRRQPQSV
jgi:uncharacterized protein